MASGGDINVKLGVEGAGKVQRELKKTGDAAVSMGKGAKTGAAGAAVMGGALSTAGLGAVAVTGAFGKMTKVVMSPAGVAASGAVAGVAVAAVGVWATVKAVEALWKGYARVLGEAVKISEELDTIGKKARSVGADPEGFQAIIGAFSLAGIEAGATQKAIQRLNQSMGEAMKATPSKMYVDAFTKLGVEARDLAELPLDERLLAIAEGMNALGTSGEQSSTGVALLGRAGKDLNVVWEGGREGLQRAIDDIKRFGVASNKTVRQSEDLQDAILRMRRAFLGLRYEALGPLIPVLTAFANTVANTLAGLDPRAVNDFATAITTMAARSGESLLKIGMIAERTALRLKASFLFALSAARLATNDLAGAMGTFKEALQARKAAQEDVAKSDARWLARMRDLVNSYSRAMNVAGGRAPGATVPPPPPPDGGTGHRRGAPAADGETGEGAVDFISEQEAALRALGVQWLAMFDEIDRSRMSAFQLIDDAEERRLDKLREQHSLVWNQIEVMRTDAIEGDSAEQKALAEQFQLMETAILQDGINARNAILDEAAEKARLRREQALADEQAAAMQFTQSWGNAFGAMGNMVDQFSNLMISAMGEENKEAKKASKVMFGISQGLAIAQATVAMFAAIGEANKLGYPLSIPAMIAAGATGAAQIAGIVATSITQGVADAGLPPGALRAAGLNNHTMLAVRNDEMVLDPVGTRAISEMLTQRSGGQPMVVNTVLEIDGHVLGQTVDAHLIRSQERGLPYGERARYGST